MKILDLTNSRGGIADAGGVDRDEDSARLTDVQLEAFVQSFPIAGA